jgi:TonB-linked SusC/RagA family outer membrane protein
MKNILLTSILLLCCLFSYAQRSVTGTVKDEAGDPIPGVTVRQAETSRGVVTNGNGTFTIVLDNTKRALLQFSMVGFLARDFDASSQSNFNLTLQASGPIDLEQVIVVGYGQQKKISVTGAISTVSSADIKSAPVASVTNALTGRVTGLVTRQSSGRPGQDDARLFIRGQATTNDSSPLVLIDGVERDFTQIAAEDIESVSILKDAAATAVYGVRGANGVVLVTTKRGTQGKSKISFSGEYGLTHFNRLTIAENAETTAHFQREGTINVGLDPSIISNTGNFAVSEYDKYLYRTQLSPFTHADNNFVETFTKPGNQQRYNVNLTGGNKTVRYFVSTGYLRQEGMFQDDVNELRKTPTISRLIELSPDVDKALVPNNYDAGYNFDRVTTRSNIDISVNDDIKFGINLSYLFKKENRPGMYDGLNSNSEALRLFSSFYRNAPQAFPLMNPNGSFGGAVGVWRQNPLVTIANTGFRTDFSNELQTALNFSYNLRKLAKGISIDGKYAFDVDWDNWRGMQRRPYLYAYNPVDQSYLQGLVGVLPAQGAGKRAGLYNQYAELALRYAGQIGDGHNLSGVILGNFNSLSGPPIANKISDQYSYVPHVYQALIGRISYDYKTRYLLELNAGYNGSNRFAEGERYRLFPAVSAGWVVTNESFMPKSDLLNFLKIRGSYGEVGNDKLGPFNYYYKSTFEPYSSYSFGEVQNPAIGGLREGRLPNENVTWELAKKSNVALESRWFESRLSLNADVFKERRSQVLVTPGKSLISAGVFGLAPENIGIIENKGFELELGWNDKAGQNFEYFLKGQYSLARNTIVEKSEPDQPYDYMYGTGNPIGQFMGYRFDGFFKSYEHIAASPQQFGSGTVAPGDIKYKDLNQDGLIDQNDRAAVGYSQVPEITYSLSAGVTFKNISLSVLLQGAARSSVYMVGDLGWDNSWGNFYAEHHNRWTPETANTATYPRFLQKSEEGHQNYYESDYWLRDGRYLRIKNVQIAYTIPKKMMERLPVDNVRLFGNAFNLYTWDKVKRVDPEADPNRNSGGFYPQQRIINFGLNVGF